MTTDFFTENFNKISDRLPKSVPLSERENAFAHFNQLGLPNKKNEAWRYASFHQFVQHQFPSRMVANEIDKALALPIAALENRLLLVFVNGQFAPALSDDTAAINGIDFVPASEKIILPKGGKDLFPSHPFLALNEAMFSDGLTLEVSENAEIPTPIHCVFVSTENQTGNHIKNTIHLKSHARATFVMEFVNVNAPLTFTNAATHLQCDEGANGTFIQRQMEGIDAFHVHTVSAHQAKNSELWVHFHGNGAAWARGDLTVALAGAGAVCGANGLIMGKHNQWQDYHLAMLHRAPHTESHTHVKGILSDNATGVFDGRVMVAHGATQSLANQLSQNIILSPKATMQTKPQLEIFTDDVRCSHGATVGRLPEEALQYLRSRGLSFSKAQQLMLSGFAGDIINKVPLPGMKQQLLEEALQVLGDL